MSSFPWFGLGFAMLALVFISNNILQAQDLVERPGPATFRPLCRPQYITNCSQTKVYPCPRGYRAVERRPCNYKVNCTGEWLNILGTQTVCCPNLVLTGQPELVAVPEI